MVVLRWYVRFREYLILLTFFGVEIFSKICNAIKRGLPLSILLISKFSDAVEAQRVPFSLFRHNTFWSITKNCAGFFPHTMPFEPFASRRLEPFPGLFSIEFIKFFYTSCQVNYFAGRKISRYLAGVLLIISPNNFLTW